MTTSLGRCGADEDATPAVGVVGGAGVEGGAHAVPSRVSAPSTASTPDEEEAIVDTVMWEVFRT